MDRIKKALDKSRSQRTQKLFQQAQMRIESETSKDHPFDQIEYSQTKHIEVPQSVLSENRVIAGNRTDPRATSFRMLRTQVLHAMRENEWTSLAVTGPSKGIGKSLVAVNLAISISHEVNQTVLLVDADFRNPTIHKYFNFEPDYGLLDYFQDKAKLEDLFVNPVFKRLVLIPGRGNTTESSELLSSPRMINLVKELKSKYPSRIVLFDIPPLLDLDDAIVFLPNVDSTLLVVENGKNTQSEVEKSMRLLGPTNLIGTVLNKTDEEVRDYYY
jgi:capsular exopolysaccharide synthesis family protein